MKVVTDLSILADAIADVGFWRWWTADFPEFIQLEFGGTMLWNPPKKGQAPSGLIALRFNDLVSVSFVTMQNAAADLATNWPELLASDELRPFNLDSEAFAFDNPQLSAKIVANAKQVDTRVGPAPQSADFASAPINLAFQAYAVGMIVAAQRMTILNIQGEVKLADIAQKNAQWWDYWREYWRRIDTADPLPRDYACEVTIPAGTD